MDPGTWRAALVGLLPLWLFSIAMTAEGFPLPPIPWDVVMAVFVLALAAGIVFLWKGWMTFELVLYSLFPFILMIQFDEISTGYKTPFILLCALFLTIGMAGYHFGINRDSVTLAWLSLLLAVVVTWIFASHAIGNYWQMVSSLQFPADCMPYASDCPLLAGDETPWWALIFRL
jgi:hypothetical protein